MDGGARQRSRTVANLIWRNIGLAVAGKLPATATRQSRAGIQAVNEKKPAMEEFMSPAQQAFLLTGELLVLSFVVIAGIWFADRLRRNFTGKL
jgi:hypothetical protein